MAFLGNKINQVLALTSAGPSRLRGLHRCRAGDPLPGEGAQLPPVPLSVPPARSGAPVPAPRRLRLLGGCSGEGEGARGETPPSHRHGYRGTRTLPPG